MKFPKRSLISAAIAMALVTGSAHAALERLGPISKLPSIGGFPTWFQDKGGITLEFCDPKNASEVSGGWCLLLPGDVPVVPEVFPTQFFDEHFYYAASANLDDPGNGISAIAVLAVESAFAVGPPIEGDQIVFGRLRVKIVNLPWDGDYRMITPYSDVTYTDLKAGERLFETSDIGIGCAGTFECALDTAIGPFLLPSATPGGAEVPPIPDLASAPPGTDPFHDLIGAKTPYPGTGKKYIADPARIGPVTGSPLPPFTAYHTNGTSETLDHNTFRIEVRAPSPNHDGPVIYEIEGPNNFSLQGRLMDGSIPGKVTVNRANYKADSTGAVTDVDVFASASPTSQSRIPGQTQAAPVMPILSFFDAPCGGALTTDGAGNVTVNLPPYTAPAGVDHAMTSTTNDFWGQSQPGTSPSYVCVKDATARNAAGQVAPAYYLKKVSDLVSIGLASFEGTNGTLKVNATSSDPTAVLTLAGYGPAPSATPGVTAGKGAATGLTLAGNAATVTSLQAPPARAQVISSKGGSARLAVTTAHGAVVPATGVPTAVNDSGTVNEDCSSSPATVCAAGQTFSLDLLANDTVVIDGSVKTLRDVVDNNLAVVAVDALAPRLGSASIANGVLSYVPNPNANGTDSITYTVTVDGKASNPAIVSINITPVNDAPVALNATTASVLNKPSTFSLIANATDPDGSADLKEGVIVTWPAQLGVKPAPLNGVITFTPTSTGSFPFTFQVKDVAGVSSNTATTNVTVQASEAITITKSRFVAGKIGGNSSARWVVTGTDSVLQGQTLTIAYRDGKLKNQLNSCDGTAAIAGCVINSVVVDNTGAYAYDQVSAPGGTLDPTDGNTWAVKPTNIRVFSSSPVLGGFAVRAIEIK